MSMEGATLEVDDAQFPLPDAASPTEQRQLVALNAKYANIDLSGQVNVSIGRKADNTVVIEDPRISGYHCKVYLEGNDLFLHDLSTNGTWVNDVKLGKGNRIALTGGEEIRLALPPTKLEGEMVHYLYRQGSMGQDSSCSEEQEGVRKYYHIGAEICRGQFGEVKKGRHRGTGKEVAIKVIKKKKFSLDPGFDNSTLLLEAQMMKKVDHVHIVKCYDVFDSPEELCIILELVKDGDLFDLIQKKKKLPEHEARQLFWQIVVALDHLHGLNIAHRDLKPENILVAITKSADGEDEYTLKLTDFGLAKQVESSYMNTVCGTPHYVAPEVVHKSQATKGYTKCVDLWSIGVILYVILSGTLPKETVTTAGLSFPAEEFRFISKNAKDLIKKLMTIDPIRRITIEGVVAHPWMQEAVPERYRAIVEEVQARLSKQMPPPAARAPADAPTVPKAHSPPLIPRTTPPSPVASSPADAASDNAASSSPPTSPPPAITALADAAKQLTPETPMEDGGVKTRKRCAAVAFANDDSPWWYWQHDETLDAKDERAWTQYGAAENAVLEKGFSMGKKGIKLNSIYFVNFSGAPDDFTQGFQFRKSDTQRQREIRRGTKASVLFSPAATQTTPPAPPP
eukprot:GGOE01014517.1.p1 GENE.GGOE01014517.1~~GGOE01014517.1.p1  ORF type:complete len:625 (+),score=224.43 GGOE01014517.1:27-1901(+)